MAVYIAHYIPQLCNQYPAQPLQGLDRAYKSLLHHFSPRWWTLAADKLRNYGGVPIDGCGDYKWQRIDVKRKTAAVKMCFYNNLVANVLVVRQRWDKQKFNCHRENSISWPGQPCGGDHLRRSSVRWEKLEPASESKQQLVVNPTLSSAGDGAVERRRSSSLTTGRYLRVSSYPYLI